MKKLLKQRNTGICNNSRETAGELLQSKACLALPGVPPAAPQPVPRSCWAASLPGSLWSQLSKPWDNTRNTTGGTQHGHRPQGVPRMCLRGHTEHPHLSPLEGWQHIQHTPREGSKLFISVMKGWGSTFNLGVIRVSYKRVLRSLMLQTDILQVSNIVVYPLHCWH